MSEQVLVSDYIASVLAERGVPAVFEMSGGMIARLLDSLYRLGETRVVSMHHEQSAAFAAGAAGAITGVPAVALATSGPGATNLLTGIGACYFDSQPAVFITGQVNRSELKGDRPIRQLGFQETDIVSIASPIAKAAWRVYTPEEVPERLSAAFELAVAGPPGPVQLDIPMDVFGSRIGSDIIARRERHEALADAAAVADLLEALARAERPLILAGGGVRTSGGVPVLRELLGTLALPLVSSLHGIDVLPYDHPQHYGMIGSYGNRWANGAIGRADLLLVLGSRLDIRQTGADTAFFKSDRTIFHVDCEPGEINHRVTGCRAVVGDVRVFLEAVAARAGERMSWSGWQDELDEQREQWPDTSEIRELEGINPNVLMHELSAASTAAGAFVADVGQHQMWAAQSLELSEGQRFMTSGGMGAMGSGLPLAVGIGVIDPRPVVLIAGDGSFQTNIQELETVVRNRLPIKIVIVNNHCHGMVRQFQESYFDGRYPSTLLGYSAPSFAAVAAAYGISARAIEDPDEVEDGLAGLWDDPLAP
ncbi:MAG: acetolactate synthase large subunit, partial [Solirubrobacteraceae bacterium]|nr:acetolactate synthase large subunit [Solirubrobacteraceae bacterium]